MKDTGSQCGVICMLEDFQVLTCRKREWTETELGMFNGQTRKALFARFADEESAKAG
jgi:hypothetical protein